MELFCRTADNELHCVEVEYNWTVRDLKEAVHRITGISLGNITLLHEGNELSEDDEDVSMLGVIAGDVVELGESKKEAAKRILKEMDTKRCVGSMLRAAETGDLYLMKTLKAAGINPNQPHKKDGTTALMKGVGSLSIVEYLLHEKASVNACDDRGNTPLMFAVWSGNVSVVRCLIECGASVEVVNDDGDTPVVWAAMNGHISIMKLLQTSGAAATRAATVHAIAFHQHEAASLLNIAAPTTITTKRKKQSRMKSIVPK
eukprot:TRINITY_DN11093_c0_g1_i1.p1 TRINITY_DN11093_c0_g1~~TRINITY_DN11093_c0_g1_i1.p1  ORF type:complete len:259 (+),score=67.91 TRINITY_DN11093_c0_g1_i1:205-981(+)